MLPTGRIIAYGSYAYRVWILISRDPDRYEGWYEIRTPGNNEVLLGQAALFDPGARSPHLFAFATDARDAAITEAKWQIDHMAAGQTRPDPPGLWRPTWRTRGGAFTLR